ncbi:MAG TPA: hypothetical protein DGG95_12240, partial [Cytophagales bacterium]|nr:hypothetical protein [Cytophagales bacterium]
MKAASILLLSIIQFSGIFAQTGIIRGKVVDQLNKPLTSANVYLETLKQGSITDSLGQFIIGNVPVGKYKLAFSCIGFKPGSTMLEVKADVISEVSFIAEENVVLLKEVKVLGIKSITGMGYLDEIHGGIIYSGKKTEVILLDSLDANTAQNNPRQILGRVPGANYSETESSGFPSNGIGF